MSKSWKLHCEANDIEFTDRDAMRNFHRVPMDRNPDGTPNYVTQQSDKDAADINKILRKYDAKGLLALQQQVTMDETALIDLTGPDYLESMNIITRVNQEFEQLPSEVRNEFKNNPQLYLEFLSKPTPAADEVRGIIPENEDPKPKAEAKDGDTTE